jgi:hypothetical protein
MHSTEDHIYIYDYICIYIYILYTYNLEEFLGCDLDPTASFVGSMRKIPHVFWTHPLISW